MAGNNELLQGIPRKNSTFRLISTHVVKWNVQRALGVGSIIWGKVYGHLFPCFSADLELEWALSGQGSHSLLCPDTGQSFGDYVSVQYMLLSWILTGNNFTQINKTWKVNEGILKKAVTYPLLKKEKFSFLDDNYLIPAIRKAQYKDALLMFITHFRFQKDLNKLQFFSYKKIKISKKPKSHG